MPSWIITFRHYSDNQLEDVPLDAVVLRDAANTFGARRVSDGLVVAASGTILNKIATGTYQKEITGLVAGTEYQAFIEWDGINRIERLHTVQSDSATARYLNLERFLGRWGNKNVAAQTNKDAPSSAPLNAAVLQDSFDYACDDIDSFFFNGIYTIPFDWTPNGGSLPRNVERWASVIAFCDLYDVRGWEDSGRGGRGRGNKLEPLLNRTYRDMAQFAFGFPKALNAAVKGSREPVIVTLDDIAREQGLYRYPDQAPIIYG